LSFWTFFILFFFPFFGGLISITVQNSTVKHLKLFLSFSGAFLFSISAISILPSLYEAHTEIDIGYFILIGFFLQLFIDYFSKGIEHGHVHTGKSGVFPWSIFLALSFHALLEGIAVGSDFLAAENRMNFVFAIALHEMPAAFALLLILKASSRTKSQLLLWLSLYALMTPIGALISTLGVHVSPGLSYAAPYMLAIVLGIFLHISTTIIFENSDEHEHKFNKYKLLAIAIGVGVALLSTLSGGGHVH
jgi:zinc and cadmium transporter